MPSVVIEGCDFVGKTTLAKALVKNEGAASEHEVSQLYQCFPDRTTLSGRIISQMLDAKANEGKPTCDVYIPGQKYTPWDPFAFQCIHFANRLEAQKSVRERVASAAHNRRLFVLDRYWPSGYAYGSNDGVDKEWLIQCSLALPFQPDVFVLIVGRIEDIAERMKNSKKGAERYDNTDILKRIQDNYIELWQRAQREQFAKKDWVIVETSQTSGANPAFAQTMSALKSRFGDHWIPKHSPDPLPKFWTGP